MSDDLEDIRVDIQPRSTLSTSTITPKPRVAHGSTSPSVDPLTSSIHLPGLASVWVKTFGCAHNISDSEYMLGLLSAYGYNIVKEKEDADW